MDRKKFSRKLSFGFWIATCLLVLPLLCAVNTEGLGSILALTRGAHENGVITEKKRMNFTWQTIDRRNLSGTGFAVMVKLNSSMEPQEIWLPEAHWQAYEVGQKVDLRTYSDWINAVVIEEVGWRSAGIGQLLFSIALVVGFFVVVGRSLKLLNFRRP